MARDHPFLRGLISEFPGGAALVGHIITRDNRHFLISNLPQSYQTHSLAIGYDGRKDQEEEGKLAGKALKRVTRRETCYVLQSLRQACMNAAKNNNVAIYNIRPIELSCTENSVAPTIEIELTIIDDILFSKIEKHLVHHDNVPVGRKTLGSGTIKRFREWATAQSELLEIKKSTGLIADPLLMNLIDKDYLEECVEIITKTSSSGLFTLNMDRIETSNPKAENIPKAIRSLSVNQGMIFSDISLGEGVKWTTNRWKNHAAEIKIPGHLPESVVQAMPGKPIKDFVQINDFDLPGKIQSASNSPDGVLFKNCSIFVECEFIPTGIHQI